MKERELRPRELVFVRHGESEANVVLQAAKKGDHSGYTDEFRNKPNSEMELSKRGVEQAIIAGEWIRNNINGGYFSQYFTSSFRRAMHTAGHLHLPEAESEKVWKIRDYLREQSYGYFDGLTAEELSMKYPEFMALKDRDGVYWQRLGGESMADLVFRAKLGIVTTMYREAPEANAIAVAHGNLLWAIRMVLEGLTYPDYERLDNPNNPLDKIQNCQILQYTRINPNDPNDVANNFAWMRSVCPWDTSLSNNEWQTIQRQKHTNSDLLAR
jgi:broad specificity phosphatase PhoE